MIQKLIYFAYSFHNQFRLIDRSGLFDEKYYFDQYFDSLRDKINPIIHYFSKGAKEGKNPNPLFDTSYYVENNPDIIKSGMNPLAHYIEVGHKQGKDPHPLFSTSYYYKRYPEAKTSGLNPLTHFLKNYKKAISPNPLFDPVFYSKQNPDVAEADIDPLTHYIWYGAKEGRDPNPLFDTSYYVENNPDIIKSGMNPLSHYLKIGYRQGRDPHPLFDTQFYYSQLVDVDLKDTSALVRYFEKNDPHVSPHPLFDITFYIKQTPEVANADITPFLHFVEIGSKERKDPHPFFDSSYYLNNNSIELCSVENLLIHFILQGAFKGLKPHPLFDTSYYLNDNPDVVDSKMNPLVHYALYGAREGRIPFRVIESLSDMPTISIISTITHFKKDFIYEGLKSIFNQRYENWELCLAVDTKFKGGLKDTLKDFKVKNQKIKIKWIDRNYCEADIINEAIKVASGQFLAFFDLFDEFTPNAFLEVVRLLNKSTDADLIYSDEDEISLNRNYISPFFKPNWSLELFRQTRYIGTFFIVRKTIAESTGYLDRKYNGFHFDEFILRISERIKKNYHIDKILYHRRQFHNIEKPISKKNNCSMEIWEKALNRHFERINLPAYALRGSQSNSRHIKIYPRKRNFNPLVSAIFFNEKNDKKFQKDILCLLEKTDYRNFEIILIDRTGTKKEIKFNSRYNIKIFHSNKSLGLPVALNQAARVAKGDHLLFIESGVKIKNEMWIQDLLYYSEQPDIGVAGNPLNYMKYFKKVKTSKRRYKKNNKLHISQLINLEADNYNCLLNNYTRDGSAVSKDLMIIDFRLFKLFGGFIPYYFDNYFDIDLCFRIRKKGLRVIQLAKDTIQHIDKNYPDNHLDTEDRSLFIDQWQDVIEREDPYHIKSYFPIYNSPLAKLTRH